MKKVLKALLTAILVTVLFSGCATKIKNPTEHTKTLLYGLTDFTVDFDKTFTGLQRFNTVSGIKVTIRNSATQKLYVLKSNEKGELIKYNLPFGNYHFVKIELDVNHNDQLWTLWLEPQEEFTDYYFNVKEGVTNLGKVSVMYNTETSSGLLNWAKHFDLSRKIFKQEYPDSEWLKTSWLNTDGERIDPEE